MVKFDRDGKLNFVDENNLIVGYSSYQNCCENWGYFFSQNPPKEVFVQDTEELDEKAINLKDFVFDPCFFEELEKHDDHLDYTSGRVTFRLFAQNPSREVYLTLYNCHNGYYSHGFTFSCGDHIVESGCL